MIRPSWADHVVLAKPLWQFVRGRPAQWRAIACPIFLESTDLDLAPTNPYQGFSRGFSPALHSRLPDSPAETRSEDESIEAMRIIYQNLSHYRKQLV